MHPLLSKVKTRFEEQKKCKLQTSIPVKALQDCHRRAYVGSNDVPDS